MNKERSFRSDETAAFDWYRSARELDVPLEVARALYARAVQRAGDANAQRAEHLYLRWLRDAARAAPAAPPPPGRQTLVTREAEKAGRSRQLPELLDPGRWTRALLEASDREPEAASREPGHAGRLPAELRGRMERAYGEAFDDVELHLDSAEVPAGQQAFTRGRHIYFERGAFDPGSEHGEHVVAHELAHVAQQARPAAHGDRPAPRAALEADAHQATLSALAGRAAMVRLAAPATAALGFSHGAAPGDQAPPGLTTTPGLATTSSPAAMRDGIPGFAGAAALREQLLAAATSGRGAGAALAAADPALAAAALRELRGTRVPGQATPALQLLARTSDGEAMRVLEHGSAGAPLPDEVAARLGPHVGGEAAGAARLHTDDTADLIAAAHHARAVTLGREIYFAHGEYAPGTERGDELLAHELTHVAQARRGELARAAAKGIDAGGTLDPSEAEADLRAKLAVIQLHPSTVAAPPLAAPVGQPTSAGDRASKIAAQQQRLTLAGQAAPPLTVAPAPPASRPQAPVAHQPPPLTAAARPASTGNAYVDTFQAPPSRQATELWAQTGAQATTKAAADQAAFDSTLQPLPVVLDGGKAADGKGAAGGGKPPQQAPAAGAVPPAVVPTPTPAAPAVTSATTAARAMVPSADKAQLKADGQRVIDGLPTSSPDVKTDPGPAPLTDLAGQADPVRTLGDQQHAVGEGAKALDDAKAKIVSGPGAARIQPVKLDEKLAVPREQPAGPMPVLPAVDGMAKFKKWNLPSSVQASFDDVAKPKMDASLADAKAKMAQAEVKRDTDRAKAVDDAHTKVTQAHADADKQQQAKVAETRTQISNHQADTLVKQENEVKKLDQQSGDKKKAAIGKINTRVQSDQAKVDADYKDAQKKADDQKKKGEDDAAQKKKEAQEKKKDESWWDKATDAICDGIKAIADEIDKALDAVCKLIGDILDAVKDAACKLIDAARDFVCQALTEFGDWLKSAVTALIGSVFPGLAAALNQLIDTAVNAAKAAVNAVADGLKKAVTALCDGLKGAIEAVIAAFKAAVQAAATLAQALVTGDWKLVGKMILEGILKLLGIDPGAFYALIGKAEDAIDKIIENPGAFVGHLVDAVKLGFKQFGANFLTHLKDGVVQWLFGTFAEAGIHLPARFDIAGVFDLTAQVLGLTWPRMRAKVVKVIGEKNTERLEFVSKYVEALMTGGFAGLWEKIQQDMSGLWDTVIGGVKSWLIEKIVQQAILKIATMWNPAGAIIQLIQTAWNVYQWVRENAQRIFGLVQAVVDSMSNIAAGNIAGAANFIEASLAKLVPIAISLFANLLGLGGIADKIRGIIEKVQTMVDNAIDKLIDRVLKMFKGKGDGKDGKDGKDGDHKDDPNDPNKKTGAVGARITFQAHGETHTQYIDVSGGAPVAMVASTPSAVKAKIEEWRPRLRELPDADQKRAGGLIGKAIAIEKTVAGLATKAKAGDAASNTALEAKQRELADTLAGLWELMAPDLDPSKAFSDQDPRATLKSPQYAEFKGRFATLATSLAMPSGAAAAQDIWLKVVTALQNTDAAYKAAPNAPPDGKRKDLSSDAFQKIMKDFEPITAALAPYMEKYAHGKKSWGFWSGKPAVEVAKRNSEVCLEKSALGGLFDNININGSWDIQMWASLSKAYATHAAAHVGQARYSGFVGSGSSADQSIFNKIEQPQFVGMLGDKEKASLHVDWYAVAGDPKTDMRQPDWRFTAGSVTGVYASGDRAAMVALAESENKRRLDLFKDKGIDEGPGATPGDKGDGATNESIDGIHTAFDAKGEGHTLSVVDKDGGGKILMASANAEELSRKAANVRKTTKAYEDEPGIPDDFKLEIMQMAEDLEAELARIKDATEQVLFAGATSGKKRKPEDVTKRRRERSVSALDQAAAQIKALATKHGLPDFSPHGVEVAKQKDWETKVLRPVQAKVDAILAKYKAQLVAAVPGASVQYRGSLASGWKGPHKLSADGSALRFDAEPYDCDAFIEVSGSTWADWVAKRWVLPNTIFVSSDDFDGPAKSQLTAIRDAIARDLGAQVPGYKKVRRGVGDFKLRLQSTAQSAHQMRTGNAYPEGAMSKAGLPETEANLPKGTAYVNDQPTPGRVMPEVHHEV